MTPAPVVRMLSDRQQAYLDAMGIGVWNLREAVPPVSAPVVELAQLKLGPGSGGVLLVCAADTDSASRLANDINRVLGGAPVWAWAFGGEDAVNLDNAVAENLFTTVAFFGNELAGRFFSGEPPAHLNSANLVVLPSMQDIQSNAGARKALWVSFCRFGMVDQG